MAVCACVCVCVMHTQGERREPLPTTHKLPVTVFAAKEAGIALVAETLRERHGRIEPVERVSIQPKGRSYSRTLFARGKRTYIHAHSRPRPYARGAPFLGVLVCPSVRLCERTHTHTHTHSELATTLPSCLVHPATSNNTCVLLALLIAWQQVLAAENKSKDGGASARLCVCVCVCVFICVCDMCDLPYPVKVVTRSTCS